MAIKEFHKVLFRESVILTIRLTESPWIWIWTKRNRCGGWMGVMRMTQYLIIVCNTQPNPAKKLWNFDFIRTFVQITWNWLKIFSITRWNWWRFFHHNVHYHCSVDHPISQKESFYFVTLNFKWSYWIPTYWNFNFLINKTPNACNWTVSIFSSERETV